MAADQTSRFSLHELSLSDPTIKTLIEALYAASPVGVAMYKASGACVYANKSLAEMVGGDRESLEKQNFREIKSWQESTLLEAAEKALDSDEEIRSIVNIHTTFGRERWLDCRLLPFKFKDDDYLQLMADDITEMRRMDDDVRRYSSRISSMIAEMEEGVVLADADDIIVEVNDYFCRFVEVPMEMIIGCNLAEFHPAPLQAQLNEYINEFRSKPHSKSIIKQRPLKESEVVLRLQPIYREDIYEGVLLNVVNVTELVKAKREAEAANKAKSLFLTNITHELRTPLNGIVGLAGLLLDKEKDMEKRDYVEMISQNAETLKTVFDEILDFTKLETADFTLDKRDFGLKEMIENCQASVEKRILGKDLNCKYQIDSDVPSIIRGDPARIRSVLVNLADNAVRFTSSGEIVLQVSRESEKDGMIVLKFAISDTGIGIPKDLQERVFDPFTQVDGSSTRNYGGLGLGLSISRHIVFLMGGEIGLQSESGRGSTVWFTVPLEKTADGDVFACGHNNRDEAELQVFNISILDDLLDGDIESMKEITEGFFSDTQGQIKAIREACKAGDLENLRKKAHYLKGASGNIGAQILHKEVANIEKAAVVADWSDISGRISQLEKVFDDLRKVVIEKGLIGE